MKHSHDHFFPDPRPVVANYNRTIDFVNCHEFPTKFTKLDLYGNHSQDSSKIKKTTSPLTESALSESFQKNFSDSLFGLSAFISHHEIEKSKSNFASMTTLKSYDSFQNAQSPTFLDSGVFIESAKPGSEGSFKSENPIEEPKASKKENERKISEKEQTSKNQEISLFWYEDEDNLLLKLAVQLGYDWKNIAKQFDDKKITATFLRSRYHKLTDAQEQSRIKFHPSEDVMLAKYFEIYGFNWNKIAEHFKDRTPIMLKNRYYSYIRKKNLLESLIQKAREVEGKDDKTKENENKGLNIHLYFSNNNMRYSIAQNKIQISSNHQNSPEADSRSSQKFSSRTFNYNDISSKQSLDNTKGSDLERLKKEVESIKLLYFQAKSELNELKAKLGEVNS